ncbi:YheC/YheD family protein [Paenibacillus allorhizosphaerae]|uniref:Endospore coat-associated protein YheD n=1 Tax=Paenibacillus allorhizosphaerae TaxID=2849866 RepID=A0ABM8VJB8_9BACL|nr:YheC/YheD family protein [Paenibacillus allorhizosphaerae]CAG7644597.1 Endospore coat-associated protein YheD [Paenibacillus allorhizosphaerae]
MNSVGILVDDLVFRGLNKKKHTGTEKISFYNKAAATCHVKPVYLSLNRMNPGQGTAYGYTFARGKYSYGKVKIPRVIHNRTFPTSSRSKKNLNGLNRISYVFNGCNRYSKYRIHQMLKSAFKANIPRSVNYSKSNLRRMMKQYDSLYIKPQKGSVGDGIMKLSRGHSGKWVAQLPRRTHAGTKKNARKIVHQAAKRKPYLIQEGISLAKYRGKPYDIRVSVQRGGDGNWHVTGIVGKVARKGSHVTNLARGGKAVKCNILFQSLNHPKGVSDSVKQLSLRITKYLGKRLNRLADVGLDIGVNRQGKPYFIELNCRDQRYSFKKAGMGSTFYDSYANPVRYAKYVLKRRGQA